MILDDLASAGRYEALHPLFRQGFEFLGRGDLERLASGRHEIDGDRVFALVNRDPGRGRTGARLEAHRKYIDIQYLVTGREEIGWRPTHTCQQLSEAYNESRDILFFADQPQTWIELPERSYMIFFPQDAHAPLAAIGDNLKVVIKVAV
jgi:YhcH/YjgK/YiaL family protein